MESTIPAALTVTRQLDQEKISSLTQRAEKLIESNNQLRADMVRNERANEAMTAHYQGVLARKDDMIATLQNQLDQAIRASIGQQQQTRHDYESKIEALSTDMTKREEEFADKLRKLELELSLLESFRNEKELHEEKLSAVEAELNAQRSNYEASLDAMEKKFIEDKFRHIRQHEEKLVAMRETTLGEAHETLHEQQRAVIAENDRLMSDMKTHMATSALLEKERASLVAECEELRRSVELFRDKESTYARVNEGRSGELKRLRNRLTELETALRDSVRQHAKEHLEANISLVKDVEESALDAAGLRTLLRYKNKELKTMTSLCATILNQRTDLESFFLQALQEVREKSSREKKETDLSVEEKRSTLTKMRIGTYKPSKLRVRRIIAGESDNTKDIVFPRINAKAPNLKYWDSGMKNNVNVVGKEFKDLSWEEKESVLRLLFAKMNGIDSKVKLVSSSSTGSSISVCNDETSVIEHKEEEDSLYVDE